MSPAARTRPPGRSRCRPGPRWRWPPPRLEGAVRASSLSLRPFTPPWLLMSRIGLGPVLGSLEQAGERHGQVVDLTHGDRGGGHARGRPGGHGVVGRGARRPAPARDGGRRATLGVGLDEQATVTTANTDSVTRTPVRDDKRHDRWPRRAASTAPLVSRSPLPPPCPRSPEGAAPSGSPPSLPRRPAELGSTIAFSPSPCALRLPPAGPPRERVL